ncbi:hypothetical protein DENSPDRAFT_838540 [Dentipellis sp. KUC8613]|nr:hypothetical protein DENSPDRAFT_838540 [Dentipellis sp. KUC8613]
MSRLAFPSRPVQSSPSVAIEKGAYRLRHSSTTRLRTSSKLRNSSTASETARASIRYERRMVILLLLVALAAAASFGCAWWLLIT